MKRLIEYNRTSEGLGFNNLKEDDSTEDHQPCSSSNIEVSRAPEKKRKNKSGSRFSSNQSFGLNPSSPLVNERGVLIFCKHEAGIAAKTVQESLLWQLVSVGEKDTVQVLGKGKSRKVTSVLLSL